MNSEKDKQIVQKIKRDYETDRTPTKLEQLKALDKKVKVPARVFAYVFGIIGALVLGVGMCLAMEVIGDAMIVGIIIGLIGIANALPQKWKVAKSTLAIVGNTMNIISAFFFAKPFAFKGVSPTVDMKEMNE